MMKRVFTLLLAVSLLVGLAPLFSVRASAAGDSVEYYLVQRTVQAGDTVATMCRALGTEFSKYADVIRQVNGMTNLNSIKKGMVLYLPTKAAPAAGSSYYKIIGHDVVAGDTLAILCRRYGTTLRRDQELLKLLNNIPNLNRIYSGMRVYIPVFVQGSNQSGTSGQGTTPSGGSSDTTPAPTPTPSDSTPAQTAVTYYLVPRTVQNGDTVATMCKALGTDYSKYADVIAQVNNMKSLNSVSTGMVLYLPTLTKPTDGSYYTIMPYVVASGDTMSGICRRYGTSYVRYENLIKLLNNLPNMNRIYQGMTVYIPVINGTPSSGSGSSGSSSGKSGGTTPTGGNGNGISGTTPTPKNGDIDIYYLVPRTAVAGDTVEKMCKTLGTNYSDYSAVIQQVNGINNLGTVASGKTLYLPTTTKPAGGSYYRIVAHKVVSGDRVAVLCKTYGTQYSKVTGLLSVLNPGKNLNIIYTDSVVYIPGFVEGAEAVG